MKSTFFGRAFAALLLLASVTAAQASSIGGGAGSVTGGSCPVGQYATAVGANGAPTCATPPSGTSTAAIVSGYWYELQGLNSVAYGVTSSGVARCALGTARAAMNIQALGTKMTTASSGGNFTMAIYANNPATNRPTGTPVASLTTSLSTTTVGTLSGPASGSLTAGTAYWVCSNSDNTVAQFAGSWGLGPITTMGAANLTNLPIATNIGLSGVSATLAYTTTWPDAGTLTWGEISVIVPAVAIQAQ